MSLVHVIPQLGEWVMQHPYMVGGGLAGTLALMAVTSLAMRGRGHAQTTHGAARFATPREIRAAGLSTQHGVVVGEVDGTIWCDDWVTHVLTVGRSRAGKGVFHIIPTLRWFWRQSVLVLDPKNGENYLASRAEREAMGRVEVFAPYRQSPTAINVCDSIRWRKPEEYRDALSIGNSLVAPKEKGTRPSDAGQHFQALAAKVLAASQLHVGYTTGHCSLGHVWHFLTQFAGLADGQRIQAILHALRTTAHVSQGVHMAIASISNALSAIASPREMGSIWSTATRPLFLYNDPYVARATDRSTLNVRDLQHGPDVVSLYLLAESPSAVKDMYEVYRVVIDTTIKVLMRRAGDAQPADVDHRLLLCLDEVPTYGYIPTVDAEVATLAGYRIKCWFLAQDIPQFDTTYGEDSALWGNTDTKLFHAPANDTTARRISEQFLGRGTVEYAVVSKGGGQGGRGTVSKQRTGRALLTPDEVQGLDSSQGIGHVSGHGLRPFLFGKVGFDPNYKEERA